MKKLTVTALVLVILIGAGYYSLSRKPVRVDDPLVTGVHYVGMAVTDLAQTARLYQQAVKLEAIDTERSLPPQLLEALQLSSVPTNTQLLRSSNAQLYVMQVEDNALRAPPLVHGPGIAHMCFQVAKTTDTYEQFLQGGATHIGSREMVQLNSRNPVEYAYIHDPDKIIVEVEHVDVAALALETPPKNDYRIRQIALATGNIDRLVAFYSALLETRNPRRLGRLLRLSGDKIDQVSGLTGSEIEMAWFQVRNMELEIAQFHSHAEQIAAQNTSPARLGYNLIMFDTRDVTAVREKVLMAGGQVVSTYQSEQGSETLLARDPDGNLIGFQSLSADSPFSARHFADNGI